MSSDAKAATNGLTCWRSGVAALLWLLVLNCPQAKAQQAAALPGKPADAPLPAQRQARKYPEKPGIARAMRIERFPRTTYEPITGKERIAWFARSTAGPVSLASGAFSAAFGTGLDDPHEYRGTWAGFGKRYAMRFTGISTGNAMEAGLGAIWGEEPRYFREPDAAFGSRVWHVIRMTFVARRRDGSLAPAYARYAAISGNNFLSNAWRVRSEAGPGHAGIRIVEGFGDRMAGNAFSEFWPDLKERVFGRRE